MPRGKKKEPKETGKQQPTDDVVAIIQAVDTIKDRVARHRGADEMIRIALAELTPYIAPREEIVVDVRKDKKAAGGVVVTPQNIGKMVDDAKAKLDAGKKIYGKRPCGCSERGPHKSSCEEGAEAERPAGSKVRNAACTDCDWKGAIGPKADIMETRCPECKGSVVEK